MDNHFEERFDAKDAWLKQVKHHKKRLKGLPRVSLNPNAGNVEHNINMFNKMNSPIDGPTNNPISGPFGGDVGSASSSIGESFSEQKISDYVKKYIETHINEIEINDFETVYDEFNRMVEPISELTAVLLDAGINPLAYLDAVPDSYAAGTSIRELTIAENIKEIFPYAFAFCTLLDTVTILHGCDIIHDCAFKECGNLIEVTLPSTLSHIGYHAFDGCWQLSDVYYNGTIAEWDQITKEMPINSHADFDRVHCLDGDAWVS